MGMKFKQVAGALFAYPHRFLPRKAIEETQVRLKQTILASTKTYKSTSLQCSVEPKRSLFIVQTYPCSKNVPLYLKTNTTNIRFSTSARGSKYSAVRTLTTFGGGVGDGGGDGGDLVRTGRLVHGGRERKIQASSELWRHAPSRNVQF